MLPVPFTLPDDGFTERKGSVSLVEEFVEIRIETSLMGEWDKEERLFKIEAKALRDVYLQKGMFRDTLGLVPKNQQLFEELPGFLSGAVCLRIWRKHREATLALLNKIELAIVGF